MHKHEQDLEAAPEESVDVFVSLVIIGIGNHIAIAVIVENRVEKREDQGFYHGTRARGQVRQEGGKMLQVLCVWEN